MSNSNENLTPEQIKPLDEHFGVDQWYALKCGEGELTQVDDVVCSEGEALEDCSDYIGAEVRMHDTFFRRKPKDELSDSQILDNHFGIDGWSTLKVSSSIRSGDVIVIDGRVRETLHSVGWMTTSIRNYYRPKPQPEQQDQPESVNEDKQLLDAEFGVDGWDRIPVGGYIETDDVYIHDGCTMVTANREGWMISSLRSYYRPKPIPEQQDQPEEDPTEEDPTEEASKEQRAVRMLNARYGHRHWRKLSNGEKVQKGDVFIGPAGINHAIYMTGLSQSEDTEQYYRPDMIFTNATSSVASDAKPIINIPEPKQPFKHPKGVNYYAEVIEILAEQRHTNNWRELVIEIAKRHPKVLVDAHNTLFGDDD